MVWTLENEQEEYASDLLNNLYAQALRGKVSARNIVKECFTGDSWNTIKERMDTEGSVWYVWYMDGVHKLTSLIVKP